jgi:benzoyl-CoA-dihydrodiol lyase
VRLAIEERAGFSPDGLIGMEANLRFAGPRDDGDQDLRPPLGLAELDLPAAQRDRPEGALKLYGTGKQAKYDRKRA